MSAGVNGIGLFLDPEPNCGPATLIGKLSPSVDVVDVSVAVVDGVVIVVAGVVGSCVGFVIGLVGRVRIGRVGLVSNSTLLSSVVVSTGLLTMLNRMLVELVFLMWTLERWAVEEMVSLLLNSTPTVRVKSDMIGVTGLGAKGPSIT